MEVKLARLSIPHTPQYMRLTSLAELSHNMDVQNLVLPSYSTF